MSIETCKQHGEHCVVTYETGHGGCPVCNLVDTLTDKIINLNEQVQDEITMAIGEN